MKIAFVLGTGVDDIDFMNVNSLLDKCKSYMPIEIHHLGGSSATYTKSGFEIRTLTVGTGHTDYNAIVVPGASSYEALVGKPEVKGFCRKHRKWLTCILDLFRHETALRIEFN